MDYKTKSRVHESPAVMTIPLVVLAVLSVLGGLLGVPEFIGESVGFHYTGLIEKFLSSSVVVHHGAEHASSHHFGHWTLVGFSVLAAFAGIVAGIFVYYRGQGKTVAVSGQTAEAVRRGSFNKWYVDEIYEAVFVSPFNYISGLSSDFDRSVIDSSLDGLSDFVRDLSRRLSALQSGLLRYYAAAMVGGVVVIIVILFIYGSMDS